MRLFILLFSFLFVSCSFSSTLTSMTNVEARNAIEDKTISTASMATLNGRVIQNTFTGFFKNDGTITGAFEKKPINAPQVDQGTWNTRGAGMVCIKWDHWNNNVETCVTLYKLNNAILTVGPNGEFNSLVFDGDVKSGDQLQ